MEEVHRGLARKVSMDCDFSCISAGGNERWLVAFGKLLLFLVWVWFF